MKTYSAGLKEFLSSANAEQMVFADCYIITLVTGDVFYYTTAQVDITVVPVGQIVSRTFKANQLLISGLKYRASINIEVDEQELRMTPQTGFTMLGQPWNLFVRTGQLDGATIRRDRYFFQDWGQPTEGGVILFKGLIAAVDSIGAVSTSMKAKGETVLLTANMPRNFYQASCKNTLFDGDCGLNRTLFADSGFVDGTPTRSIIPWAGSTADYYALGTIRFSDGPNAGQSRSVKSSSATQIVVNYPFEFVPEVGNAFVAYPGCDKTMGTCETKFNNLDNYIGFPFVPVPETAA
jgi:uncharacterized phage protein (TIGR02218 family)